jgi:hypothetical protein
MRRSPPIRRRGQRLWVLGPVLSTGRLTQQWQLRSRHPVAAPIADRGSTRCGTPSKGSTTGAAHLCVPVATPVALPLGTAIPQVAQPVALTVVEPVVAPPVAAPPPLALPISAPVVRNSSSIAALLLQRAFPLYRVTGAVGPWGWRSLLEGEGWPQD